MKIVLVVTDGDPNDRAATKYIIYRARADGIPVLGLGLGVGPVPVIDPQYAATIHYLGYLFSSLVKLDEAAFEDNRRLN